MENIDWSLLQDPQRGSVEEMRKDRELHDGHVRVLRAAIDRTRLRNLKPVTRLSIARSTSGEPVTRWFLRPRPESLQ